MKELEHLTVVSELPTTIEPAPFGTFIEQEMAYDNLSQSLDLLRGSLKHMLNYPNKEKSVVRFDQLVVTYGFDYVNYINASRDRLIDAEGPYYFVGHLPEIVTSINNTRIDAFNGILKRFGDDKIIEYTAEEIAHDMDIPRLREVNEDESFVVRAMQSARKVIGQQLGSESSWIMDKRSKRAEELSQPRPSRLHKTATRITSLFM